MLGSACAAGAFAQRVSPCDPTVEPISGPYGYKQRGAIRCEGLYRARTGGEIELISYIRRLPRATNETNGRIQLDVPALPDLPSKIVIRVSTLKEDVFYQLDAVASPGTTFEWLTSEVLDHVELSLKDLAFLGWRQVGKEREFVPLSVRETASSADARGIAVLIIRSPLPLERVMWRFYRSDQATESAKNGKFSDVPGNGFAPGSPIEIRMPVGLAGPHIVDVYAMPQNRDIPERVSVRLLF